MRSCDNHRSFPGIEIANTHPPRFEFWTSLLGPRTMIRFLPRSFFFCPILSLASRFTAGGPFTVSALRSARDDRLRVTWLDGLRRSGSFGAARRGSVSGDSNCYRAGLGCKSVKTPEFGALGKSCVTKKSYLSRSRRPRT
jgi:hypothetical protein